ncbi:MAG: hypothetical protein RIQ89_1550 [Bacteroidota bacterium]|jgi:cytochrome c2
MVFITATMTYCYPKNLTFRSVFLLTAISLLTFFSSRAQDLANGEKLFKANCTQCHAVHDKVIGPALAGVENRHSEEWLIKWIKNSQALVKAGDPEAVKIFNEYNKSVMTSFPSLKDEDVKDILAYIKSVPVPSVAGAAPASTDPDAEPVADNSWVVWLIIIGATLYLLSGVLRRIQETLARTLRQRNGEPEPAAQTRMRKAYNWARLNKKVLAVGIILLVLIGSVKGWYALQSIGIQQGYKPEQPIKFSHILHAGKNKVACVYCHVGANKGKVAGIPSLNVCMNCHKYVKKGPQYGTEEIAKIYKALDYDPDKGTYGNNPKPIQWVRVHNLPDLAYFNHAQHYVVGKIACETCHGPVKDSMTVVAQYSPLTMGWCIDCHRKTPVKMAGNGYYNDLHKDLLQKYGKDSLITVEKIGGTECSRCHY